MIPIKAAIFAFLSLFAMGVSDVFMKIFVRDFTTFGELFSQPKVFLSGIAFASIAFVGLIFWMLALKFGDLSELAPIQKMSFIITVPLAIFFLGESFSMKTALAVTFAITAVVLLMV